MRGREHPRLVACRSEQCGHGRERGDVHRAVAGGRGRRPSVHGPRRDERPVHARDELRRDAHDCRRPRGRRGVHGRWLRPGVGTARCRVRHRRAGNLQHGDRARGRARRPLGRAGDQRRGTDRSPGPRRVPGRQRRGARRCVGAPADHGGEPQRGLASAARRRAARGGADGAPGRLSRASVGAAGRPARRGRRGLDVRFPRPPTGRSSWTARRSHKRRRSFAPTRARPRPTS